ncbi:MAG: hypothetical protein ABIR37_01370 [Candidatus Saccharimonadales bacterium]
MTTQQLTEYLPRPDRRSFKRKTKLARIRVERLTRAHVRKARSISLAWYRRQYFLSSAYTDLRISIARNEDIYLAILMIAIILGYAYSVVAAQLLFIFFGAAYALGEATGMSMVFLSLITVSVLGVSLAWVAAFAANSLSLSLMHGANHKKIRSLRRTLREGLSFTSRTTAAWTLVVATVFGPLMIAALGTAIYFKATNADMHTAMTFLPYIAVTGVAWALYALMQFSLVPQVAIFEPQLSLQAAFSRSRQLVRTKGKVFLSVTYCTLAVALAALYGISALFEKVLRLNQSVTFIFGLILMTIFTNGILTVFYRKRRLARR